MPEILQRAATLAGAFRRQLPVVLGKIFPRLGETATTSEILTRLDTGR